MRVLQVNCVYKTGSTGKIVYDLHTAYQKVGIESYVCYGRGIRVAEKNVYKTASEIISKGYNLLSRFTGIQYGGTWGSTGYLINKIREIQPDIVHLHCINGFFVNIYELLRFLKKAQIKTVLTLHAEFMYTGSCGHALDCTQWMNSDGCKVCPQLKEATYSYFLDRTNTAWRRMNHTFEGFDRLAVVSVSPWLEERARQSWILRGKNLSCVFNGIDTDNIFFFRNSNQLKTSLGLDHKQIVLHVTACFNEFKGAQYIFQLAEKMPHVTFIVIGNRGDIGPHPENILPIGRVEDQHTLAEYYSMADVTVLTSKRETFSMICAESLSCGTPVVGFCAGAPETICIAEYSSFCEYGNTERLHRLLENALKNPAYRNKNVISQIAAEAFSRNSMCESYIRIYKGLIDDNK